MGPLPPQPITIINIFNEKYIQCDPYNTEIEDNTDYCILHNIGQEGFNSFCNLNLPCIKYLCLSKNNISNITFFKDFKAPSLVKLDLSYNIIKNIDIFEKVSYPLQNLDLSNNRINDISIFKKESTLKNLQYLSLKNNNINFNDKKNKEIMSQINERIKKNIIKDVVDEDEISNDDDETIQKMYDRIKTLNDKFKSDLNVLDKDLIKRIKKLQVNEDLINEIKELNAKLKRSTIVNNNPYSYRYVTSKTFKKK